MEKYFHLELDALKSKLIGMASIVQSMVTDSIQALVEQKLDVIKDIRDKERSVNLKEIEIDAECLKLIALYQPVGRDLRLINMVSKINNDLERIGDEAINISERVEHLIKNPKLERGDILPKMENIAKDMLDKSISGLAKDNLDFAEYVFKQEDFLDALNRQLIIAVIDQIKRRPEITELALDIISISHRLERIGDIAVNIAEDVKFFITGEDARHPHDKVNR